MSLLLPGSEVLTDEGVNYAEVLAPLTAVGVAGHRRFEVVAARRRCDGQVVAIKYLIDRLPDEDDATEDARAQVLIAKGRLRREAEVSQAVQHPHLLPVEALLRHEASGFLGVVTPLCLGPILHSRTDGSQETLLRAHDPVLMLTMVEQVWSACEALHAIGGGHRDVKPSNILVHPEGRFVLADLDHATLGRPSEATLTTPGVGFRSAHYTPVEPGTLPQWDAFSLGETLRACLPETVPPAWTGLLDLANAMRQPSPGSRLADGARIRDRILALRRDLQVGAVPPHLLLASVVAERLSTAVQAELLAKGLAQAPVVPLPPAPLRRRWVIAAAVVGPVIFVGGVMAWRAWGPCATPVAVPAVMPVVQSPPPQAAPVVAEPAPQPLPDQPKAEPTAAERAQIMDALHKAAYANGQTSLMQSATYRLQQLQGGGRPPSAEQAPAAKPAGASP